MISLPKLDHRGCIGSVGFRSPHCTVDVHWLPYPRPNNFGSENLRNQSASWLSISAARNCTRARIICGIVTCLIGTWHMFSQCIIEYVTFRYRYRITRVCMHGWTDRSIDLDKLCACVHACPYVREVAVEFPKKLTPAQKDTGIRMRYPIMDTLSWPRRHGQSMPKFNVMRPCICYVSLSFSTILHMSWRFK